MNLDKFLISKHRYGDKIYSTIQMLDNNPNDTKYIILLNTSLYMKEYALNIIIECLNIFLKDHSIILVSYGITGIIKYYNQGDTLLNLPLHGSINQTIPFELLNTLVSRKDTVKILFITVNVFNNHFRNYDDYDRIYKKINKIKYKAKCCSFYTFLIGKSLDRNNSMKFVSLGYYTQTDLILLKESLLLQLIELQTTVKNIEGNNIEFYDTNNMTIGFMQNTFKSFAALESSDDYIINSTIISKLSLQLQNLKENKLVISNFVNNMVVENTNDNKIIDNMLQTYKICNNYGQKILLLNYHIIKFAQLNDPSASLLYTKQCFEKKLSFIKCCYTEDNIYALNGIYNIWCNGSTKKNIKNNKYILIPLYLNKDHYNSIKLLTKLPVLQLMLVMYLKILLSDIVNNNILMKSSYFSEYVKFLRYYIEDYFKVNDVRDQNTYCKILLIIFKLHTNKCANINLSLYDLDTLLKLYITENILPLHDKTIVKLLFTDPSKILTNKFGSLVKKWNYTLHKQRYTEYIQFKNNIKKSINITCTIDDVLQVFCKFYGNVHDIFIVCNYFLNKTHSHTNSEKLLEFFGMNNVYDVIEFMLCSDIDSIKKNYVSHITIFWTIYFMKLYDVTINEINAMDNTSLQDKSLEEIKYELLSKA